ncbi:MAG: hypothetical protein JEZ07_16755 [Phycisphaerae bacterium]|nr:hypothetical protein [Phycisphaerae bacterium]
MEISGSKYSRKTYIIYIAIAVGFALYCFYDGFINKKFIIEHSNMPNNQTLEEAIKAHPEFGTMLAKGDYKSIDLDAFPEKTDDSSLAFSKYYGPLACIAGLIYSALMFVDLGKKKIVTDDKGLTFNDGTRIDYEQITGIDKRNFKNKGKIIINCQQNNNASQIILKDRVYDNLGLLLDEIVSKTGATPEEKTE